MLLIGTMQARKTNVHKSLDIRADFTCITKISTPHHHQYHHPKLQATFDMSIQSAYYNDKLSAWEPIVEPINVADKVLPWCIDVKVCV